MVGRQIPLDLSYRPAMTDKDFVIGSANRDAHAWIARWPDWPGRSLALFGPEGSGKSHLASIWMARSGAILLARAPAEGVFPDAPLVLDNPSRWPETLLLHLLNTQRDRGQFTLVIDRLAPARWQVELPDLSSRLNAIAAIELQPPDDALLMAVMAKHFADRNQTVAAETLQFLARRVERSYADAIRIVAALDRRSLAERRAVTLALARETLAALDGPV